MDFNKHRIQKMDNYKIVNGIIVQPGRLLYDHAVVVKNQTIIDITKDPDQYAELETIDAKGNYIAPGFIEMHIHGCSHYGFDQPEQLDMTEVISFLKQRGINTFLPTFLCNRQVIRNSLSVIAKTENIHKSVPGIYIEGPFINRQKKGGISEDFITHPDSKLLWEIAEECGGWLKLMTVAPEIHGSHPIIHELIHKGITPCLGHSAAELSDLPVLKGEKINITHLFNAMSPISHKTSGLAMYPFLNREVFFELNGDGVHVNDDAISMCYHHLNKERLILISDAVISSGLEYGEYESYGRKVISSERGVRYKEDDVLMGSAMLMNSIVKRFIEQTGAPLHEAVRFATLNPAMLLGIHNKRGSIETGKEADIILLDHEYQVIGNLF